jgi:hypothetical protein
MARNGKPRQDVEKLRDRISSQRGEDIDRLYGLEPVFEPGAHSNGIEAECYVAIQCPWCGERLDVRVDVTGGAREYVDDCEVCCRPMELTVELDERGALDALRVRRQD